MIKSLEFTQNQTVFYAVARPRDDLQSAQFTTPAPGQSAELRLQLPATDYCEASNDSPAPPETPGDANAQIHCVEQIRVSIHAFAGMTGGGL